MKKRLSIGLAVSLITFVLLITTILAYGVNLSFPAARRSKITQGYSSAHQAYDYRFARHTQVAAAKAGTVDDVTWQYQDGWPSDCQGFKRDRGNFIILDHGNNVETRYYHLSNAGNTPGVGAYFDRGEYMALSDDTGCSGGDHLHFSAWIDGTSVDPYAGTTHWVSGSPIPMGYRDQNGTMHGPYALDYSSIENKWLELEGEPGSPLGDDYNPVYYETWQQFERGYISVVSLGKSLVISYHPYAKTYLPDIRIDYSGWDSTIIVRNKSDSNTASVNITFYKPDGKVADSRTHTSVPARGTWMFDTSVLAIDSTHPITNFTGSAVVAASEDVSVVVENKRSNPDQHNNYNGISPDGDSGWGQVGGDIYVPLVKYQHGSQQKTSRFYILNTGSAATNITLTGYYTTGVPAFQQTQSLGPNACWDLTTPTTEKGQYCARIQASQPLAVVVAEESDPTTVYKIQNAFAGGAMTVFVPQVKRNWSGDFTTLAVQNVSSYDTSVTVTYYPDDAGTTCFPSAWINSNGYHIFEATAPECPNEFVGSARVSGGRSLAVLVNERGVKGYSGFLEGSQTAVLPRVQQGNGWWTGIRVMNVDGASSTSGTIYFYKSDGGPNGSQSYSISGGYRSVNLGQYVPDPFNGSAVVTANHPIAAAVTMALNGGTSERTMIYNGVNR